MSLHAWRQCLSERRGEKQLPQWTPRWTWCRFFKTRDGHANGGGPLDVAGAPAWRARGRQPYFTGSNVTVRPLLVVWMRVGTNCTPA